MSAKLYGLLAELAQTAMATERRAVANAKRAVAAELSALQLRKQVTSLEDQRKAQKRLEALKGKHPSSSVAAKFVAPSQKGKAST
ncbi:hypothetical protein FRC00_008514, partial [Tulasnella sp. 408]